MALIDDLKRETDEIVKGGWSHRQGEVVPEPKDLRLTNDAVDLQATFLYADLADSTELVFLKQEIAAEVMRAYLRGATRIIRSCGGDIRSFDGDRVMGVFIEGGKNTAAAKAGLQINYFFSEILKPAFASFYTARFPSQFELRQTVGIDTSDVMVVRGGLRDDNDLVWVGRAPNIAAKLSAIRESGYSTYITRDVFVRLLDESRYGGFNGN
jgi:class 3 adenylate cyclase